MKQITITEYYQNDHLRLDKLFDLYSTLKHSDSLKAKSSFQEFKIGLQRHIVWEENILFPVFEKKTNIVTGGPIQVMKQEHRQIKQYLESIHEKVKNNDFNTDSLEKEILSVLSQHNLKEENILYPYIDKLTNKDEKNEIFIAMDELPKEAYEHCCSGNH